MSENHFDKVAHDWDMNKIHQERTNAIASLMQQKLIKGQGLRGLEFGAGTGLLSIALAPYFREIVLLDSSGEMVKVTREKLEALNLRHLYPEQFDLELFDYPFINFDLVFSQMALHHVKDVDVMLGKFHSLLTPGAYLAIADLHLEDGSFHERDFNGHLGFNPEELKKKLELAGFQHVQVEECYKIVRPLESGAEKSFPVFLLWAEA